jgi:hypothetical protein
MADGRMFIGQQAVDAGLADQIVSLEELINQLNQSASPARRTASPADPSMDSIQPPTVQAQEWATANPEAAAVLRAEGAASERDRIAAVRSQAMPGHESLIEQLAADGRTTGPEAAVAVLAAEKSARANQATMRQAEAPRPIAFAPAPESGLEAQQPESFQFFGVLGPDADETAIHAKALEYQAANPGAFYQDAIRAITTNGGN